MATVSNKSWLTSRPVSELDKLANNTVTLENVNIAGSYKLTEKADNTTGRFRLKLAIPQVSDWSIVLSNSSNEQLAVGYNKADNSFYFDRTRSGKVDFEPNFAKIVKAPRIAMGDAMDVELLVDAASLELFADGGITSLTGIFFPNETLTEININAPMNLNVQRLEYAKMATIWVK
ncbi:MAG: GH32 C-terminal domain-containing protein [Pyrinomonadaceae bacterium]